MYVVVEYVKFEFGFVCFVWEWGDVFGGIVGGVGVGIGSEWGVVFVDCVIVECIYRFFGGVCSGVDYGFFVSGV